MLQEPWQHNNFYKDLATALPVFHCEGFFLDKLTCILYSYDYEPVTINFFQWTYQINTYLALYLERDFEWDVEVPWLLLQFIYIHALVAHITVLNNFCHTFGEHVWKVPPCYYQLPPFCPYQSDQQVPYTPSDKPIPMIASFYYLFLLLYHFQPPAFMRFHC